VARNEMRALPTAQSTILVQNSGIMKSSLKGALLSGLIFPGLGQVILKHYTRGIALMLTVLIGLFVIVVKAVQHALTILEAIESQSRALDMSTISSTAMQVTTSSDSLVFNLLSLLIIFCWIIGVVDAYRSGRKTDIKDRLVSQASSGNDS